ncbi:hypothetical protein RPPX_21985 [Pseudomonas putida S12]|uniref:Uncharacterized protein n=1 Tax=Pseudomonas putida S12 TaxID=1215087 RepID=A0AA34WT92_PSEPU|nr:hypothetical protein RPPX_21985 [Pseudomonas putida S12]
MIGFGWAAKDAKLIVSNGLELMFSQQPQTLELRAADTFGLCLMISFHSLYSVRVHWMIWR